MSAIIGPGPGGKREGSGRQPVLITIRADTRVQIITESARGRKTTKSGTVLNIYRDEATGDHVATVIFDTSGEAKIVLLRGEA